MAWTREEKQAYERAYYANNVRGRKDRTKAQREARKDKFRAALHEHLTSNPCVDCGESDIVVLEFDHLPGCEKLFDVGRAWDRKWDDVVKEISKCEVVCCNCHRRRTTKRSNGWRMNLPL